MAPARPTAAISDPHTISARGFRLRRGINPHCAASVAEAPAIITIAIDDSEPCGSKLSRSMTKKPMHVRVAACACPAATPATIQERMRESFQLSRFRLGEVAASTLAPVGCEAPDG